MWALQLVHRRWRIKLEEWPLNMKLLFHCVEEMLRQCVCRVSVRWNKGKLDDDSGKLVRVNFDSLERHCEVIW